MKPEVKHFLLTTFSIKKVIPLNFPQCGWPQSQLYPQWVPVCTSDLTELILKLHQCQRCGRSWWEKIRVLHFYYKCSANGTIKKPKLHYNADGTVWMSKIGGWFNQKLSCSLDSGDSGCLYLSWFLPWFRGTALVQSRFLAKHELGKL